MAVKQNIKNLLESLGLLIEQHFKLFQRELSDELRTLLGSLFGLLLCLLPLLFGYIFVNIALVFLLELIIPSWVAWVVVGLLNFALGVLGIGWLGRRLSNLKFLPETLKELFVTRQAILKVSSPPEHKPDEQRDFVRENTASQLDNAGT